MMFSPGEVGVLRTHREALTSLALRLYVREIRPIALWKRRR